MLRFRAAVLDHDERSRPRARASTSSATAAAPSPYLQVVASKPRTSDRPSPWARHSSASMASPLTGQFIINGVPFSGTGVGYNPDAPAERATDRGAADGDRPGHRRTCPTPCCPIPPRSAERRFTTPIPPGRAGPTRTTTPPTTRTCSWGCSFPTARPPSRRSIARRWCSIGSTSWTPGAVLVVSRGLERDRIRRGRRCKRSWTRTRRTPTGTAITGLGLASSSRQIASSS